MKFLPWVNIALAWSILILGFHFRTDKRQWHSWVVAAFLWCGVTALYLSRLFGDR